MPTAEKPRMQTASTSTASMTILTSFCSIFLPRYSGVRPTISPAMNTARMANKSMPYNPDPTPPKTTSPNSMLTIGTRPPSGVRLSCALLTAPQLASVVTTDASCGAVNNAHDSLTPLGGLVPMVNIELGEVVFGGVGSGLYGMLLFAILAVFIAGLMVGRTPEYLGKKIEQKEVKMVMLAVLVLAVCI